MPAAFVSCAALQNVTWLNASSCPYTGEQAVFRFALPDGGAPAAYLRAQLQADELRRAGRYHREADRQRFTYSRGLLRLLTGRYLNQSPTGIRFVPGVNHKPELPPGSGLHINVSHSGDWILLVLSKTPVGIDVEYINPQFSLDDLMAGSFSLEEQRQIRSSPNAHRHFYQLWTRKEALVKATAKGLDDAFQDIPALDGNHVTESHCIGAGGPWTVQSFHLADDYAAAVAYGSTPVTTAFYNLGNELFMET